MAIFYANLIMGAIKEGMYGVMAAHRDGKWVYTDLPGKNLPARRVNPDEYHEARYRPRFEQIAGVYQSQELF